MKTYLLTSSRFEGHVLIEYADTGLLVRFDASQAVLTDEQQSWLLREMPKEEIDVLRILGNSKTSKLEKVKQDITFDLFWEKYAEKVRSSKKKTLVRWNKLSKIDQIKAFNYIQKYEQNIPAGTIKKYAETYLSHELWNN